MQEKLTIELQAGEQTKNYLLEFAKVFGVGAFASFVFEINLHYAIAIAFAIWIVYLVFMRFKIKKEEEITYVEAQKDDARFNKLALVAKNRIQDLESRLEQELKLKENNLISLSNQIATLEKEKATLKAGATRLKEENATLTKELIERERVLATLSKENETLASKSSSVGEYQKQVLAKDDEIRVLKSQVLRLSEQTKEVNTLKKTVLMLQKQLQEAKEGRVEERKAFLKQETASLRMSIKKTKSPAEVEAKEKTLKNYEEELNRL